MNHDPRSDQDPYCVAIMATQGYKQTRGTDNKSYDGGRRVNMFSNDVAKMSPTDVTLL